MKIYKIVEVKDPKTNEITHYVINDGIHTKNLDGRFKLPLEKFLANGGVITPSFTEEERIEILKDNLIKEIRRLADLKSKSLKNYITGKPVTTEQVERYESKYETALEAKNNEDYSAFTLEAAEAGLTPEELVDLIIQKHDEWMNEININNTKIDAIRVILETKLLNGENIDLVEYKMNKLNELPITVTDDEINEILTLTELPETEETEEY